MTYQQAEQIYRFEQYQANYLSWIAYKKAFRIVRYYPTLRMYEIYANIAKAHGLHYFFEDVNYTKAHKELCTYLQYRLQFLDN